MIDKIFVAQFTERVKAARSRFLCRYPFFGMLMINLRFGLDERFETAATNGTHVVFGSGFAGRLSDDELDFVVMHELMHVALDHISRGGAYNQYIFNVACDIVVNSSIMEMMAVSEFSVDGSAVMHLAPDGSEGHLHSAEEVYHMLITSEDGFDPEDYEILDIHHLWGSLSPEERAKISGVIKKTAELVSMGAGNLPAGLERAIGELHKASIDWRRLLNEIVQVDVLDYTFSSPDRRYSGDFIMPGLVPMDSSAGKILFMVDTSGSIQQEEITAVYSEIRGSIEQFGGKLSGMIGFFDSEVTPPVPFESVKELLNIVPVGGGGTDVYSVFNYVKSNMTLEPPSCIVILTDGWLSIPPERMAMGIPVLWLFTTRVPLPKWGRGAYIEISST